MSILKFEVGTESREVKELQCALLQLGYELPKHGTDGVVNFETIGEIEDFAIDHGGEDLVNDMVEWWLDDAVVSHIVPRINSMAGNLSTPRASLDVDYHDITNLHPRKASKGQRPWKQITGITLHQTGIMLGNNLKRFESLRAHIGILRLERPTIVQVYPLNTLLHHANAFNKPDVGIEINGCFEGIDGLKRTAWKGGYRTEPHRCTNEQIIAARESIRRICAEVEEHDGKVVHIHAHRQTSRTRQSDPGSRVWQEVGVWAQDLFGLTDGGDGYTLRNGMPIPTEWDPKRTGKYW